MLTPIDERAVASLAAAPRRNTNMFASSPLETARTAIAAAARCTAPFVASTLR